MLRLLRRKFPACLQSKKSRIAFSLFDNIYIVELGRNKVVGRLTSWINEFGWITAGLIYFTHERMTLFQLFLLCLEGFAIMIVLGIIYYVLHLDKIENLVASERNPMLKEVHEVVTNERKRKHI